MVAQNTSPAPARIPPAPPSANKLKAPAAAPANKNRLPVKAKPNVGALPFWGGIVLSLLWVSVVLMVVARSGPARVFGGLPLVDWAIGISAIVSPVALIWMVAAYLQRAADIQTVADPLRRQLSIITGESGAAEARIRRFNQAIREQIDLLKNAQNMSQNDLAAIMDRVRHHREDLERFEHASINQVKDIQEIVRRNMQQVEQLMDDKFTMLRVLDDKLVQNGDAVARQTESVRDQVVGLLQEIDTHSQQVTETLERATQDSKKLADTARAQEATLVNAAENASETLNNLSGKIDLSVARFLERTSTAREEAERLAGALDAQTRSLDEFSNNLPARVSEAESVIRGVADRLYASEQLAREQALILSDKLSQQVDNLQGFMDRFTVRLTDIDGGLLQRRNDLDALANRIGGTTTSFMQGWEQSIQDLSQRTDGALARFTALGADQRHGVESVSEHLAETTAKYEATAIRMNRLAQDSNQQMKSITDEIAAHLAQFEALGEASRQAGAEVENRAASAMQNLQYVLERLLTAREATQSVGTALVKDLYAAVDQNEQLITRLNDAAQMSVHALGLAAESLGKQEGSLTDRACSAQALLNEAAAQLQQRAEVAEQGLRQQAQGLVALLGEAQGQMTATEQRLQSLSVTAVAPVQDVVRLLDVSADQGRQALARYGEGVEGQLAHLQQFHSRVGGMGEDLSRITVETLNTIEQLNNRFIAVRTVQEETARQTLEQFADLADRMQREITGLDGQAAQAATLLQQAAARVGEQSYQLLQNAENSGAKMQLVTNSLQNEATQIRAILQKQADDLGADLNRAEKQFVVMGEALQQRANAAYALLDRVAAHYNDTTRAVAEDLDSRTGRFQQVSDVVQNKSEELTAALAQHLTVLTGGATQLETQASAIGIVSGKALQHLSSLNEKLTMTSETANANARQIAQRLEETGTAFLRQNNALSEAAQTSAALIRQAGSAFGEQTSRLLDSSQQIDQNLRQLTAATSTYADQSTQIRSSMEQQNQRLVAQLVESTTQLEVTGRTFEQTAATAATGADQASSRFTDMAQNATAQLNASQQNLQTVASKAESLLSSFGTSMTQQAASLSIIGDQLNEQYQMLTSANESQRTQLVDLFDKLGSAHAQASDVAERTIARLADQLNQIQRSLGALSDQSQTAVGNIRAASDGFADQSGILLHNAQAAEQQARTVLSVTSALQDQARILRESMENESERAGAMLGGFLSKLSAGGIELREMTSISEVALGDLNNNITQQTQGLQNSMQQIGDRQRSLSAALDAQREVLNGLLSRLNLAQDETAAVAERTAQRLTESAQQIVRQTETISAQAQNAQASVQATGAAFVDQAGTLNMQAQQAEQQMRGVLTVTANLQDQARQLREAMQNETVRAVEQLNTTIAHLDAANNSLKQHSSSAIHAMDQTALQFATLAHTSAEAIHKQADVLSVTTEQAENRMAVAGERMRGHLKLVGEVGDRTEAQARQLADVAEYATNRLGSLRETITDSDRDSQGALENTAARIQSVKTMLQDEMQRLVDLSQHAVLQVINASEGLVTQSDALRANLALSESALTQAANLVRDESRYLPDVLERSTATITAATGILKDQIREADDTLVGTADRFVTVTMTARESMVDEMRRISVTAEQADTILRQFSATLAGQVVAIQKNTAQLSGEQKELVAKAIDSVAQLSAASDRLAHLRGDATATAAKLAQEFDLLDQRAASTGQRLTEAGQTVMKNVDALAQVTQRAENQMLGASSQFRDQLERIRAGLQGQIDDINRGLMQITAQLERTGNTLRSTTAGTVADVERIAQRFDETSKDASTHLTEKTARMRGATEEVAKLLGGFGEQLDVLLDRLALAGDGIRRQEGGMIEQLQQALSHLGSVAERLETSRKLAMNVSEQTADRLGEIVTTVQREMQNLTTGSQAAAGIIRGIGQIYGEQTQTLNHGVREAHGQVLEMNKAVDDMQQRADRMRVSLKLQSEELMGSLEQILRQLSETGDALESTVDHTLREQAAANLKKIS